MQYHYSTPEDALTITNNDGTAITGISARENRVAVFGRTTGNSVGVLGECRPSDRNAIGVLGDSPEGTGVAGSSTNSVGVSGSTSNGSGVSGLVDTGTGVQGVAVVQGTGVFGNSGNGTGVFGNSANSNGVFGGSAGGVFSTGVRGHSSGGEPSVGVLGTTSTPRGVGVWGVGGEWAGLFDGNVRVTGSIIKPGGGFRIDHPLEPARKSLSHSFVESPDMKNVYDGVVALDENGECRVELPEWFDALNCDFRYQLTSIGEPAPNLHVAREISNNRFDIAGGKSGMKVSWQVTGIRKDSWAQAHPLIVEEEKPESERGYFLHPELYGQPRENSTLWRGNSDLIRHLEERRDVSGIEANQIAEQARDLTERMRGRSEQVQALSRRVVGDEGNSGPG